MHLVSARGGDDGDLAAGSLAIVCAVGVGHHVELAYGFDAQKLPARAARSYVDERRACVFNPIQQEEIVLGLRPEIENMLPTEELELPTDPER